MITLPGRDARLAHHISTTVHNMRLILLKAHKKIAGQAGYVLLNGRWHSVDKGGKNAPKSAPKASNPQSVPKLTPTSHFTDDQWGLLKLDESNSNSKSYNGKLDQLKDYGDSGNVSAILAMQIGTNTYGKKLAIIANQLLDLYGVEHKVVAGQKAGEHPSINTVKAKEPDTKVEPEEKSFDMPEFIEGKTTTGVVSYYEGVSNKIMAMADAGDLAGLEKMKADGLVPSAKGKVSNTFKGSTANSKLLLGLHQAAVDKLSGSKAEPAVDVKAKTKAASQKVDPELAAKAAEMLGSKAKDNLSQINWDKSLLPETNSNWKTNNKKVAEIKALALAGDIEGLKALKTGTNTYGKKQALLIQVAIAGLEEAPVANPELKPKANPTASTPEESGPSNGDTKQGASGMLVFKDGHWHKVEEAAKSEPEPEPEPEAVASPVSSVALPEFTSPNAKHNEIMTELTSKMKAHIEEHGAAGFKGILVSHKNGMFSASMGNLKVNKASPNSTMEVMKQFHGFVVDLKLAAGENPKAALAAKAATTATPKPSAETPKQETLGESMDNWEQTGPQGGTNPGGKYKDENGVEWYCKFPSDPDAAKAEVLAAKLYAAAGLSAQNAKFITKDGKLGIASLWVDVDKATASKLKKADGALSGFAADAWLANWDVVGMSFDNLQLDASGKAVRVDAGGSLMYRAQGDKKPFGNEVLELETMLDPAVNKNTAAVFGKMTKADITASVSAVLNIPNAAIMALVTEFGPGSAEDKKQLLMTLVNRKADMAKKYPKASTKKVEPKFDYSKISTPPDFLNWSGPNSPGPSSKEFLNQANNEAVTNIHQAAKTGSAGKVGALLEPVYNKDTGEISGTAPVLEHPSQHVKGYAKQVINEINFQLNPPKQFRLGGEHPLSALNASYPAASSHVGANLLAKFIDLGDPGIISLASLGMPKITHQSGALTRSTYAKQARELIAQMPSTQLAAVKSYTGNGYMEMNTSLWDGNPNGKAKAASEALHTLSHDIAPGTVLSRKLKLSDSAADLLLSSVGKVLQEPAIMSTSIRPSSWSGNVQLKMHVGPGVKGLWVGFGSLDNGGALSNHAGEDELILPPNTRLLILSHTLSSKLDEDGFGGSSKHVIEAIVLPSEGY